MAAGGLGVSSESSTTVDEGSRILSRATASADRLDVASPDERLMSGKSTSPGGALEGTREVEAHG